MKLEIDRKGLRFAIVWEEIRVLGKIVLPVIATLLTLAAAPEVSKIIALLGW
jgi:hypothetical protein